jgi:hypothetical protein
MGHCSISPPSFKIWRVRERIDRVSFECRAWQALLVCMLALGINKQLDLQTALTETGRMLAFHQGWYEEHREVEKLFIASLRLAAIAGCVAAPMVAYYMPRSTRLALCGLIVLTAFALIRASSFHHVDILLNTGTIGLKLNWILEIGGILLVLLARRSRLVSPSPTAPPPDRLEGRPIPGRAGPLDSGGARRAHGPMSVEKFVTMLQKDVAVTVMDNTTLSGHTGLYPMWLFLNNAFLSRRRQCNGVTDQRHRLHQLQGQRARPQPAPSLSRCLDRDVEMAAVCLSASKGLKNALSAPGMGK